jgi:hypothetical protein
MKKKKKKNKEKNKKKKKRMLAVAYFCRSRNDDFREMTIAK